MQAGAAMFSMGGGFGTAGAAWPAQSGQVLFAGRADRTFRDGAATQEATCAEQAVPATLDHACRGLRLG